MTEVKEANVYEYKTKTTSALRSWRSGKNEELFDALINEEAVDGWRLHSVANPAEVMGVMVLVFERRIEAT
jgi:hypothetical protein